VLAVQQPLSLITLDIQLPGGDGWEFLTRLKDLPALKRIPVVIISIVADRNKGLCAGRRAVMENPYRGRSCISRSWISVFSW
jgi:CheY-like chemotaxis protein